MTPERLVELTGNPMIARLLDEIMALKGEIVKLKARIEELRTEVPPMRSEVAERDANANRCRPWQQRRKMAEIEAEGNA